MAKKIAVAGKGGTGKTTLCALIIAQLVSSGKTPVLAIDADPNNCLNELLGVMFEKTVVSLADELMKEKENLPAGLTKERYLELNFQGALVESKGFDLLVMGHPEKEGCYCAANNMLKNCVERLCSNYAYIVMDNEAGMEHLSRRTSRSVDELLILANPSKISIKSADRIRKISEELKLDIKNFHTVINNPGHGPARAGEAVKDATGEIPFDSELYDISLRGGSIFELDEKSESRKAASDILEKLGI